MARPYSLDLRERVVAAVASGMSRRAAAAHYQVSESVAIRWAKRVEQNGQPRGLADGWQEAVHARRTWRVDPCASGRKAGYHRAGIIG